MLLHCHLAILPTIVLPYARSKDVLEFSLVLYLLLLWYRFPVIRMSKVSFSFFVWGAGWSLSNVFVQLLWSEQGFQWKQRGSVIDWPCRMRPVITLSEPHGVWPLYAICKREVAIPSLKHGRGLHFPVAFWYAARHVEWGSQPSALKALWSCDLRDILPVSKRVFRFQLHGRQK